ncbi:MAG: rRNA pseudouridine synthase [Clostridium argentinense]|uniref:Pseudouridine synthase n=1 Tax=Clostridium faecium TaxID=2762223 RepID=A0ABR8YX10_9CLOT|nr:MULTISPECIES: pseudouridine synthase [Clostridium]MBD8048785.1 rRNA pseudouridine synthase [Clostridium faecium]MBS5824100.1 rRNA pseudouridine synthase [Clostridium argentinense]MDU1350193.1 pseudouridine synthase [Clostridium argentinense]
MQERLQKYMASCGVASRRKCEEIILDGKVKVNDKVVTELGVKIDPEIDKVIFNGKIIKPEKRKVYIALHKPEGYVSTVSDERGRKTIIDLIDVKERIYPIGRLDYDTSGLILLTNDGDVYNNVIHPREIINKVYIATVKGVPTREEIDKLCKGVDIGGYITAPAQCTIVKKNNEDKNNITSDLKIIIHEGKNRQVRKMCDAINHKVIKLKRLSVGKIKLGNLPKGKYRFLNEDEIKYLKGGE